MTCIENVQVSVIIRKCNKTATFMSMYTTVVHKPYNVDHVEKLML